MGQQGHRAHVWRTRARRTCDPGLSSPPLDTTMPLNGPARASLSSVAISP